MPQKDISIRASYTVHIDDSSMTKNENAHGDFVGFKSATTYYACYEFDLSSFKSLMESWHHASFVSDFSVIGVSLDIPNQKSRSYAETNNYGIYKMNSRPSTLNSTDLITAINSSNIQLGTLSFDSDRRTISNITLSEINTDLKNCILNGTYMAFVLKPIKLLSGVDAGGRDLVWDVSEGWRKASNEATFPPTLRVKYTYSTSALPKFGMYYTTVDPTTPQVTPVNSLGGHKSTNTVYPTTYLLENLGIDDTNAIVASTPGSPYCGDEQVCPTEGSGLVQIGPEIASYSSLSVNSLATTITGLTRGLCPATMPSSIDPEPQNVRYLHVNSLFNNQPLENNEQYRCVAVFNEGSTASNIKVSILQRENAKVKIDVGIEIPSTDSVYGQHSGVDSSAFILDTTTWSEAPTQDYVGATVIVNPLGTYGSIAIITSFEYDIALHQATIRFSAASGFTINCSDFYVILPAASQVVPNDVTAPSSTALFNGFLGDGGSRYVVLRDHGVDCQRFDLFYLWIKKTSIPNTKEDIDSGAVIALQYTPPDKPTDYSSKIMGLWSFNQDVQDSWGEHDFERIEGLNQYRTVTKYNLLTSSTETNYGLLFDEDIKLYAGTDFNFRSGDIYGFSIGFWWYSPRSLGLTRHLVTRESTPMVAPILAKAETTISGDTEQISTGEWAICEAGTSDSQNVIRVYLCGSGSYVSHIFESEPYEPGLHYIYIIYKSNDIHGTVSIEIDGKSVRYENGPGALNQTASNLWLNKIYIGSTAYKTHQTGALISELMIRSDFIDLDDSTRLVRYGWNFTTSNETFFDKFNYLGVSFHQPSTISTNMIVSSGSDIIVARSNGEILRGSRPAWDVEHHFDNSQIIPLLRAQNPSAVSIANSKLTLSGTSIRIP